MEYHIGISRACRLLEYPRSDFYYVHVKNDDEVMEAIQRHAEHGDGFWKIYWRIRREGIVWNHKRVWRVYKLMHYEKRSKLKKRLPARVKQPLVTPEGPNVCWSIDFVSDKLESGRKFRVLNIVDDYDRSAVAQEISMSMPAQRVVRLMEKVMFAKGKPMSIRCDNGPEFISKEFKTWCDVNCIELKYTQPGCPTQNSYIERFNGSYRRAVLDAWMFRSITEVRAITDDWMLDYNTQRPHESLGNMTPYEYRKSYFESIKKAEEAVLV